MRSPSDGRDIAGEDRSSEGEQASSGSRGQFVVAAKKYKVPQQRQYISLQVEPFAGPNGPRVNFDDLRVQQEMNAEIELLHRAQDIVKWIVPEGFSAVTTALRTLPAPFRELGTKLADKNEAVRPRAAH